MPSPPPPTGAPGARLFDAFLSTPEMLAVFDDIALVQAMLDVEAALALSQAECGLVPLAAATTIARCCVVDHIDLVALAADGRRAGTLVIPLVRQLTAAVARHDAAAAGFVHWGSTSQDIIDTAQVLLTRHALRLIDRDLVSLIETLLAHASRHLGTPVLARTLMQPAQVTSLGLKFLGWVAPLIRARTRLTRAAADAIQLQLGGAIGTLSSMGDHGAAVTTAMAARLSLRAPLTAWHTQRDEWVTLGATVGVLCGSLAKIATDLSLMAQGEIGELAEPSGNGRGGSSAMPHKRNPVASLMALANGLRAPQRVATLLGAMAQQHERGLGNWQAELAEWVDLFTGAHGALASLSEAIAGLGIDTARMRENIDALKGLVFAEALSNELALTVGKSAAHTRVEALSRQVVERRLSLHDVAREAMAGDTEFAAAISDQALDRIFDLDKAAQPAAALATRQLAALQSSWYPSPNHDDSRA